MDDDPVIAWQVHCDGVQAVLDDPETAHRELTNPHIGSPPLETAIDQFYTTDVFMHTWDLSRATGQDDRLDPDFCAQLLGGMEQMEQVLRSSGQYGARVSPAMRISRPDCWASLAETHSGPDGELGVRIWLSADCGGLDLKNAPSAYSPAKPRPGPVAVPAGVLCVSDRACVALIIADLSLRLTADHAD
ncbi:hypothetical protein GCM10023322_11830 [Rugosimonospora acidiphila]|uniref:TIGR03086 family protein n=1 Tax=Rugosimonospora acidiphila TaxID=556531 RepID=A0ABP9RLD1_9ACTN